MKFKVYLSSLTLLLATFLMVNAQTNSVTGKVTDGIDNLFGVNVIIQGTNTEVITDEDGVFTISSDLDLPWTLEVSSLGFSNQTLVVKSITQLISLSLVSGKELDEVVVSGARKAEKISESLASITTVSLKEIENRPTFNAVTLLDNIVGVQVDKQGANLTNVTLRDNADIFSTSALVMLDYRDITQIGMGFFSSENTNLSTIDLERVEVVRGPQAAIYGPGVDAGVIHYQSKDAFKYPGSTLQLQMGAISNGGSLLSNGNFNMKSVFFRHAVSNDDKTFGYKFNLRYTENGEWDFSDSQKSAVFGATGTRNIIDPLNGENVGQTSDYMKNNSSRGADATLYYRPNNNFSITTVAGIGNTIGNAFASGTGEFFSNQTNGFLQFRMKSNNLFMQYNYTTSVPGKYEDEIGFNYRDGSVFYLESSQSQLQIQYELALDALNTDLSLGFEHKFAKFDSYARTFGRNEDKDDYRVYGAYFASKTKLTDDLNLSLSGRKDYFPALGENSFSPRVGLVWQASPRHSVRLTYNKAYTPPSALALFLDLPLTDFGGGLDVFLIGNSQAQTFDNIQTKWLFGGGAVPSNPGIGMPHATLFGVLARGIAPILPGTPLAGFIPWITSQNTLAAIAGTGGFTDGFLVDLNGRPFGPLEGGDKGTLQMSQTYELGFNGMLSDNVSWSFDIYNANKENFFAQTILSPFVALPTLATDFAATVFPSAYAYAFNTIFGGVNGFQPFANQLATGMVNTMAGAAIQGGLTGAVGIIETDQAPQDGRRHIMMGYKNFGKISYWGFDTAIKWKPSDNLTMFANYSTISETEFTQDEIGALDATGSYYMNHSKQRVKTGLNYASGKWVFGLSHKYDDGFNANMGIYSGNVESRNIYDTNLGLKINSKTSIDLAVYNLLGEKYSVFPGMPEMGMSGMATLKFEL